MTSYENERRDAENGMPVLPSAARTVLVEDDVDGLPPLRAEDDVTDTWIAPKLREPARFTSAGAGLQGAESPAASETVLAEADRLIYGARAAEYGSATREFDKVAIGWDVIISAGDQFGRYAITAEKVGLCMAWLKIVRELNKHKRDNLVDAAGYIGLVQKVFDGD